MKSFKEFLLEDEEQQDGQLTFDKINLETYIKKSADKNIGPFYGGSLLYKELKDRILGDNIKTIITRIINQAAETDDNPNDITEKDLLDVLTINPEDYEAEKVEDVSKALFVIIVRSYSSALFTQGGKVSIKNMLNVRDKNYFKSVFNELIVKDSQSNQNNQNNQNNEPYKFTETASKVFNKITADVLGSGSFQIKKIGDKIINAAKGGIDSLTKFLNGLKNQHIDAEAAENLQNDTSKTEREKALELVQSKRHREKGRGLGNLRNIPDEDENGETSGYGNKYIKLNIDIPVSFGGDPQGTVNTTFKKIYEKAIKKFDMLGKDAAKKLISGNASKTRKANKQNDKEWEDLDEAWASAFANAGKMNKTLLEFTKPSFAVLRHKLSSGPKFGVGGWKDDEAVYSGSKNNYITNFEENRLPTLKKNFEKLLNALQQEYKKKTEKTIKELEERITYQRKKGLEIDLNSDLRTYVYKVEKMLNDANKKMVGGFLTNIVRGAKNAMIDDNEAAFDDEKDSSEAVATFNKIKQRLKEDPKDNKNDLEAIAKIVLYLTMLKTSSSPAVALKSLTENGVRFPEEIFRKERGDDFVVYDLHPIKGEKIETQRKGAQVGLKVTKYDLRGEKIIKDIKGLFSELKYFDGLDLNTNVLQLLRNYLKKDTAIKSMVEQYKKFINQAFNEIQAPVDLPTNQNNEHDNTANNNSNTNNDNNSNAINGSNNSSDNNNSSNSNNDNNIDHNTYDTNDYTFSVKTESFSEFYKHWKLLKEDTYEDVDYINELKELVKNDEMSAFLSKPNSNFNLNATGIDDIALRQLLGGKIVYDFGQFWIVSKDDNLVQKLNSKLGQEKPENRPTVIDLGELEQNFNNIITNPENLTQAELENFINAINNYGDQVTAGEQTSVVTSSAADSTYGDGFRKGQTKITYSPNSKLKIVKTI